MNDEDITRLRVLEEEALQYRMELVIAIVRQVSRLNNDLTPRQQLVFHIRNVISSNSGYEIRSLVRLIDTTVATWAPPRQLPVEPVDPPELIEARTELARREAVLERINRRLTTGDANIREFNAVNEAVIEMRTRVETLQRQQTAQEGKEEKDGKSDEGDDDQPPTESEQRERHARLEELTANGYIERPRDADVDMSQAAPTTALAYQGPLSREEETAARERLGRLEQQYDLFDIDVVVNIVSRYGGGAGRNPREQLLDIIRRVRHSGTIEQVRRLTQYINDAVDDAQN
jgi:hypothetical protein